MSKYKIPTRNPNYSANVGWDARMTTFFRQVYDLTVEDDSENDLIFWVGAEDMNVPTLEKLQVLMSEYVEIPPEILAQLIADYDEAWVPSPLQRDMRCANC